MREQYPPPSIVQTTKVEYTRLNVVICDGGGVKGGYTNILAAAFPVANMPTYILRIQIYIDSI